MLESFDPKPERFPTPHQIAAFALWGVLLAIGGCAGFMITIRVPYVPWVLGAVFCIGALGLLVSLLMLIVLGVRDWVDHFRE